MKVIKQIQAVRLVLDKPLKIEERKRWNLLLKTLILQCKKDGIKMPVYWEVLK